MPLFGSPNVSKLAAKGDLKGLIKALGYQRDWLVRRQAVGALKAIGDTRAIEALVGALGDSNSAVRDEAAEALKTLGVSSVEPLVSAPSDGYSGARSSEAEDVGHPGSRSSVPMPEAALPAIRVFVSSTFRDMAAEHEELVKRVFPQLRMLCEERGVTWREVDLRYGITEEQAAEGQVLPISLAEIDRSRPYFIGLLGERYGWVPDEIPPELVEQEPWLAEHAGRSVIELEFLHGALRNPEMAEHAFFYLRDPAYLETVPQAERGDYRETDPALTTKLAALKQRIRDSGLPVREDYHDPEMLGALVLADFTTLIDSLFPARPEPQVLQRQGAEQEAFAASRAGVYIGRKDAATMAEPAAPEQPQQRAIRVFVSSTFRDMAAEREELVKFVFPQLRKRCEERGVAWGEVDLRWGITDEQAAEGQVLPICLAEIERSRPYFIGLLGERYGWVPNVLDPALIEQEPWLDEHAGRSVTELEIFHGVLNDPAMAEHAFFYLRDPAFVEGKSPEQYRETAKPKDIAEHGPEEAERLATERSVKLATLKERIRSSGLPVHEDYPDPRALGEAVLADLSAVIERLYPAGSEPDPLTRETTEHEAFAQARCGVYIGRPEYFSRLDSHAAGDGPPLVVRGESGSGKSALLANWASHYRAAHPDEFVLMHFIGASPASTDWAAMVRRIIGELSRRAGFEIEIPEKPDALRIAFTNALHMAAAKGRVVLLLDALNQLEDREAALDLAWLPPAIPAKIRLILTTLPGRSLTELQKRAYPTLAVQPLEPAERKSLIVEYLKSFKKALDEDPRQLIASSPQCANPLYLRAVLNELRLWGEYETLGAQIDHYLEAPSVDSLYELILERYEADYERDRPGLVRDAFSLLWAARRGLSETELLDLLGTDGQPLPRAFWSPLFLAAESSLTSRSGLLGFFHDYLRQAVERFCLPSQQAKQAAHVRIADYFAAREVGPRKIDELPWQMARAQAWQRLADLLADLEFLQPAWTADQFEVKVFWAKIEDNSPLRMVDSYRPILDAPAAHPAAAVYAVAALQRDTGHLDSAISLTQYLLDNSRGTENRSALAALLGSQASMLQVRGNRDAAMALLREMEQIYRELGEPAGLAGSLGNQAIILTSLGEFAAAMALLDEGERICRQIGDQALLARSLSNQGNILAARGDLDGALVLYREAERIFRQESDLARLAASLGNQGTALWTQGDLDGAMSLHKETERICRELGDPASLQVSLGNQALILQDRGDLDGAMSLHKEAERICREIGDQAQLARSLRNQANILAARGDLDGALVLYREAERIFRQLADLPGLALSLGNQAAVLQDSGDLDAAMAMHKETERIARQLGDPEVLQASLSSHALILQNRGNLDGAMALHKEAERICRQIGNPEGLAISLTNQASLLGVRMGRRREALPLVAEAYEVATQHGLTALAGPIRQLLDGLRQG